VPAPAERSGFIGLGSNQGDRRAHLRAAIAGLGEGGAEVTAVSELYETAPVGEYEGEQPDFINTVVAIRTALGPHDLLDLCKAIEVERGRDPGGPRHGPRPLDVDILLLGDLEVAGERLRIPHPGVAERRFVLAPLAELVPHLVLPTGETVGEALARVERAGGQRVERVGPL
jgi:2-amino-4-hydroxy-6-hydroxymethyldihydropteridine diphosphokinase